MESSPEQSVANVVYILEAEKWGPKGAERQPIGVYALPTLYALAAEETYLAELAGGEDGHNLSFAVRAEVIMDFRHLAESGTAMGAQTGMWRWWPAFGGDWEEVAA